jgi:3-oxoacyl-[acyl-carrier protein] reductase
VSAASLGGRALVAGTSGAIGAAVARRLQAEGLLVDRDLAEPAAGTRAIVHCPELAPRPCSLLDLGPDELLHAIRRTVGEALALCQAALRGMPDGGEIILTASLAGLHPTAAPAHVAAAQAGLHGLVRASARELGARGLRVNLVVAGVVDGMGGELPAAQLAAYRKFSALGRTGQPDEIAAAVAWLALRNRFMTGQLFPVTGGL